MVGYAGNLISFHDSRKDFVSEQLPVGPFIDFLDTGKRGPIGTLLGCARFPAA